VAGAAAHTRKTAGTTRHPAGTGELASGATTHTRDAALAARATAGSAVLAAGAAVAAGIATAPARILLEDHMSGCRTGHRGTCHSSVSCGDRQHSNPCGNSPTDDQ
jgi:hypothetical protein